MAYKDLIVKARTNPKLRQRLASICDSKKVLTATQRGDLVEVIKLAKETPEPVEEQKQKEAASKLPNVTLQTLPGLSPMQVKAQIDKLGDLQTEMEAVQMKIKAELDKLKGLEKEHKEGIDLIKDSAKKLSESANYVLETKKNLISFQIAMSEKVPGIEQMIARPGETKDGEKAGDLFGQIAEALSVEVAQKVEELYSETKKSLTHMTPVLKALKITAVTSSVPAPVVKKAGLDDVIVGVREWLTGKANAIAARILGFTGDIKRWAAGFKVRTEMAKKDSKEIKDGLDRILNAFDKAVKAH